MKKQNFLIYCSCVLLACGLLLSGCHNSTSSSVAALPEPTAVEEAVEQTPAPTEKPAVETREISVTVLNLSNMNVGMFSIIDPLQNTQTDINKLDASGTLNFTCNWPVSETKLQWAVYDTEGELLLESTTDLTDCNGKLSILLSGDDIIDDVDTLFD